MTRRTRSRFPETAKLASGVVVGGVALGLVVSLAVQPEMKRPPMPLTGDAAQIAMSRIAAPRTATGPEYGLLLPAVPGELDYDDLPREAWTFESAGTAAPASGIKDANEAARAAEAVAREAAAAIDSVTQSLQSDLVSGGLH